MRSVATGRRVSCGPVGVSRASEVTRCARWAIAIAAVTSSVGGVALALRSYATAPAVYDALTAITGECRPEDAANTPKWFPVGASTTPSWPGRRCRCRTTSSSPRATRGSPASSSVAGGSRGGPRPVPR